MSRPFERHGWMLLAGATLACLLPFAGKAFHVDDPLFVWVARHIVDHPVDPYGFDVNWTLTSESISKVTKNPPLVSYAIAAAGSFIGWGETTLHLLFLLPAVLVVLGTLALGRRFAPRAPPAAWVVLASPVFLLCATGITCDVPMLALWIGAVLLWHDGLEDDDPKRLAAAAIVIATASLTKYFGMSLIPLVAAYALAKRAPWKRWAPWLALPVVPLAAYQLWTQAKYGRGLLLDAAAYATQWSDGQTRSLLDRGLVGLAFTGGCVLPALALAPILWRRGWLAGGAVAAAGAGALIASHAATVPAEGRVMVGVQAAFFVAGGIATLALAVDELRRERSAEAILLAAWVGGTFVFASFVNWTINGRSILPMVPAVGILVARALERRAAPSRGLAWVAAPLALSAIVGLTVTAADARVANAQREAVRTIREKAGGRALWSEGHWGFQYYAQEAGARQVDVQAMGLSAGDIVAFPYNNTRIVGLPKSLTGPTDHFELPSGFFASTLRQDLGAGFYASVFGPLPYALGPVPAERFGLIEVKAR